MFRLVALRAECLGSSPCRGKDTVGSRKHDTTVNIRLRNTLYRLRSTTPPMM
jgi:hypothetical protein